LFAERSTPEKMFEVIERYRPTILTTVPTMINAMLNAEMLARVTSPAFAFVIQPARPCG